MQMMHGLSNVGSAHHGESVYNHYQVPKQPTAENNSAPLYERTPQWGVGEGISQPQDGRLIT